MQSTLIKPYSVMTVSAQYCIKPYSVIVVGMHPCMLAMVEVYLNIGVGRISDELVHGGEGDDVGDAGNRSQQNNHHPVPPRRKGCFPPIL